MIQFIIAAVAAVVLSIAPSSTLKGGDSFTFNFAVTGPFEGQVCALIGYDQTGQVVAQVCANDDVKVEAGKTLNVEKSLKVPESAAKGAYSAVAGLVPEDAETIFSEVIHFTVN